MIYCTIVVHVTYTQCFKGFQKQTSNSKTFILLTGNCFFYLKFSTIKNFLPSSFQKKIFSWDYKKVCVKLKFWYHFTIFLKMFLAKKNIIKKSLKILTFKYWIQAHLYRNSFGNQVTTDIQISTKPISI